MVVPPEMFDDCPLPESLQVVVKVSTVLPAFLAKVTLTKSEVYGETVLVNWNTVVAAAPAVKLYQPVVVKLGLGVPEPPDLVNPV